MERKAELERAIENNFEDPAVYSVYADFLQSHGDVRGELITLQLAGKDGDAKALIEKHADVLLGPLAPHQKVYDGSKSDAFTWRRGFIDRVWLSFNNYAEKLPGGLPPILEALFEHPSGRYLREIAMSFNGDPNEDNLDSLLEVIARAPRPWLRKLHLGDFKYAGAARDEDRGDDTEISWYCIGNAAQVWQAVPRLETLIMQSGSSSSSIAGATELGDLDLPNLRHLEFRTGGIDPSIAEAIARSKTPALEHLDLWFGSTSYGAPSIEQAQAILDRTDLPKLRHLGLMNAAFTDELIPRLARSPLLAQLAELDLSLGALTDEGARELGQHAAAFRHLVRLDVSHCFLTSAGIDAIRGVAREVVAGEQRDQEDDDRYPAVQE